jgi:hypothetical protein
MSRIYRSAAAALLLFYPGSLTLAASGSGLLDDLAALGDLPRAQRHEVARPVAEALVGGDRGDYDATLAELRERLADPEQRRALGPLALELEEAWEGRLDERYDQARRRELHARMQVGKTSLLVGAILGGITGLVVAALGGPAILAGLGVMAAVALIDFLVIEGGAAPSTIYLTPDRPRPSTQLPMGAVHAAAALEADDHGEGAATSSRQGSSQATTPCDPDSAMPSYDCLIGGD